MGVVFIFYLWLSAGRQIKIPSKNPSCSGQTSLSGGRGRVVVQAHIYDSYAWFVRSVWSPFQQVHTVHSSELSAPRSSDGASFVLYESIGIQLPKEAFRPSRQVMNTDCGCMTKLLFLSFTSILYSATYVGRKLLVVYTVLRRTVSALFLHCHLLSRSPSCLSHIRHKLHLHSLFKGLSLRWFISDFSGTTILGPSLWIVWIILALYCLKATMGGLWQNILPPWRPQLIRIVEMFQY